ncbi:MAG TPA: ferredoxin [Streptosporangiaceae bacterium]|nr:ferredoxin [Streptosporangiaceae bacterium]
MRVSADTGSCCGSGNCTAIAPAVFGQSDDDGTVILLDPHPPARLARAVRAAADRCPSRAISLAETPRG